MEWQVVGAPATMGGPDTVGDGIVPFHQFVLRHQPDADSRAARVPCRIVQPHGAPTVDCGHITSHGYVPLI